MQNNIVNRGILYSLGHHILGAHVSILVWKSFWISHCLLRLCSWSFILFHPTSIRFSWSTHLPICLFVFEDLTSIIRTDLPILVVLIDLMNSAIIFYDLISNDHTQIINFPTWLPGCDSYSPALLNLFLSSFQFYNGFPSILKFWSCFCLGFHSLSVTFTMRCSISLHCLWIFLC